MTGVKNVHSLERGLTDTIERLTKEFDGVFDADAVRNTARESFSKFEQASVTEYVPVLVYRNARATLLGRRSGAEQQQHSA